MAEFAERVVALVSEPDYRPITLKAMARRLEVDGSLYPDFRRAVKDLVRDGKLHLAKDKTLKLPDRSGMIVGLFRRSAKGFGFVRPHHVAGGIDQVYIALEAARDASTGDEVAVKITRAARGGGLNAEGRIVEVIAAPPGFSSGHISRPGPPASSRSTARPSTIPSPWETQAPRGPGPATRSSSRSCNIPRLIARAKE